MKQATLLVVVFLSVGIGAGFGQDCGKGRRSISIFVQDGFALENPRYQLFSVSPISEERYNNGNVARFLSKTFFPGEEVRLSNFWVHKSYIIPAEVAEKFLKTYKAGDYRAFREDDPIKKNESSGAIKNGHIEFFTGEMYSYPYILKISSGNLNPVYLLGDYLGGCFKKDKIVFDGYGPIVLSGGPPYD